MRKYYTEQVHKLDSDKQQEEFNIALIDTDLEQLQKRIEEAYDVTYSGALRYKDENYDLESSKENITALRNKIARLGPVSVNSIEDCLETPGALRRNRLADGRLENGGKRPQSDIAGTDA